MDGNGLAQIVPPAVVVSDVWEPEPVAELLPEEEAVLGTVCAKRRTDFTLGRACARRALGQLGATPGPVLRGPAREPVWPDRVAGSITHCDGYWAAAVGWRSEIGAIGIDAEPRKPLSGNVLKLIATDAEARWLAGADRATPWDVLLFSAKESVFKAWYAVVGTWLGFDDAELEFDHWSGTFRASLGRTAPALAGVPGEIDGRYAFDDLHVFTCAQAGPF
jgi:4'-phosphopantetheinyl transferase EntD